MKDINANLADWHLVPCREWTNATNGVGYGLKTVHGKHVYVHREAYELAYGPIPAGLFVCHHCDNPPCYEPIHLFAATNKVNMNDAKAKGRTRNHGGFRGEANVNSKITQKQAEAIRIEYARGDITQEKLGRRFGIGQSLVSDIVLNKVWRESR